MSVLYPLFHIHNFFLVETLLVRLEVSEYVFNFYEKLMIFINQ